MVFTLVVELKPAVQTLVEKHLVLGQNSKRSVVNRLLLQDWIFTNTNNLTFRNGINNGGLKFTSIVDKGSWGSWGTSKNNVQGLINSIKSRYQVRMLQKMFELKKFWNKCKHWRINWNWYEYLLRKNITITGNIVNSEPKTNAGGQFAQTIIIADNIKISKDVTCEQAWLIASGEMSVSW